MTHTSPGSVLVADITGCAEAADRLGVCSSTVTQWRKRNASFPRPICELRCGPVYLWSEISAWYDAHRGGSDAP